MTAQPPPKCPVTALGEAFDPFNDPYISDPYAFFKQARREEPVFYSPEIDHWVVSGYDHVKTMLSDTEVYSSSNAQSPIQPWPAEAAEMFAAERFSLVPNLSNNDPPSHTHVRRFLNKAFSPRRITWLEPHVRRLTNEAIDEILANAAAGESGGAPARIDLVADMLYELPAKVLFAFLGIPAADIDKVKDWSAGRALLTWGKLPDDEIVAQMPTFIEYLNYCYDLVDGLADARGDDYTSEMLTKLEEEAPEDFDRNRIVLTLFGLLMAGHETTTNQSANGVRTLLEHGDAWDAICADPTLIPNAVEEIIRHESSVIAWRRTPKVDVEFGDVTIPAGAQILVLLGSAIAIPSASTMPSISTSPAPTPTSICRSGSVATSASGRPSPGSNFGSSSRN